MGPRVTMILGALGVIATIATGSVTGVVWLDNRHVAMDQYSQDMSGLLMQQKASERRAIQRDMRRIKSNARIEGRPLTPMEQDDLDELQDQLEEIDR